MGGGAGCNMPDNSAIFCDCANPTGTTGGSDPGRINNGYGRKPVQAGEAAPPKHSLGWAPYGGRRSGPRGQTRAARCIPSDAPCRNGLLPPTNPTTGAPRRGASRERDLVNQGVAGRNQLHLSSRGHTCPTGVYSHKRERLKGGRSPKQKPRNTHTHTHLTGAQMPN